MTDKFIKLICVSCKKEYVVSKYNKTSKCCSKGCSNTYRASKIPRPNCDYCGKTVNRRLSHCYRNKTTKVYCNKLCESNYRKKRTTVVCQNCKKSFERRTSHIRKNIFCSKKCEGIGMKDFRSSISIQKRSFGECAIVHLLKKNFPQLVIENNNRKELDGLEMDIWLPELKVCIEYNGIHHFKPVYGNERFLKTQSADLRKRKLALEKGIKIIDLNVTYHLHKTSKTKISNLFQKVCSELKLTPTTYQFDSESVLTERRK